MKNNWGLILLAIGAVYFLSKKAGAAASMTPQQAAALYLDPTTGMYSNPMNDPCNMLSSQFDGNYCGLQGRTPFAFQKMPIDPAQINAGVMVQ